MTYTVNVANRGTAPATNSTITDTITLGTGNGGAGPYFVTNTGSCTYAATSGLVTCTTATIPAGGVWTVTITGQVTTGPGVTIPDTVNVSATESGTQYTASASTTTPVMSNTLPGFVQTKIAGVSKPTFIRFAPNGDAWIGEQTGTLVIYHNGALLPNPVVTLPNVYSTGETGLLGLAFDPNFATNGYVYISYVVNVTNKAGVTQPFSQLSRFTAVNNTINTATEKIYYRGNQAQNQHHPGNDVHIGADGKLWWSVGDNVPVIQNAATLTNIYGKILRFNLDGSVPADNPFLHVPNALPYIYALGVRNPFRFTILPNGGTMMENTGSPFVYDVWEDLYLIHSGDNYGWPYYSGYCGTCGYINPTYEYGHEPQDGAASAIAAYSGNTFPRQFAQNVVFFGDYNRGVIDAVKFDPTYQTPVSDTPFDTSAGTISDLQEGPDGNLYFTSVFSNSVYEISAPGPFPPTAQATASPSAGPAPLNVQFSSAGSSDPHGLPISYSWNFGDGSPVSTAPNPSHVYSTNGTYTGTLTVSNGAQTGTATAQVFIGHTAPTVSITAPSNYNAGDTVPFSANATDANDGTLPPYAYNWKVDFYRNGVIEPSWYAGVPNPFFGPATGITSGSFQVPTDPSQVPGSLYRITLTVTDSLGISTTVTKDVTPNLANLTVSSNVAGAGFSVDGAWHTGTYSVPDVVGVHHWFMGEQLGQMLGGTRYRFAGWADGSALSDKITTPPAGGSYTADYEPVSATMPTGWQAADIGAPLMPGYSDYTAGSQSFYLDGAGADEYGANDQSRYVYQSLNGDGTIIARVRYQSNSDPWAKAGVMIRQSTATGANFVDALVTPDVSPNTPNINGIGCIAANGCLAPLQAIIPAMGHGARMQTSGSHSATPGTYPTGFSDPSKWLKLQKAGNNFTSWMSSDGVNWTQIGITTVTMTGPVDIGIFDTSHDIGQFSTVAFDDVQITGNQPPPPPGQLPSPWVDTDVGSPALAGSASYNNGVFTVNGAGADIYGTNDQFNYVYQPANGSGTIIARVTSQTNTSSNAKAGVMFKQSTTAGSNYMLISSNPAGGIKVQYDFNGSTGGATYTFPNVWMKLTWLNGAFTASTSSDGVNWTAVVTAKTLPINSPATIGLFECSHNTSAIGTATFDNVSFTP